MHSHAMLNSLPLLLDLHLRFLQQQGGDHSRMKLHHQLVWHLGCQSQVNQYHCPPP